MMIITIFHFKNTTVIKFQSRKNRHVMRNEPSESTFSNSGGPVRLRTCERVASVDKPAETASKGTGTEGRH
jgi:hypothetical protein